MKLMRNILSLTLVALTSLSTLTLAELSTIVLCTMITEPNAEPFEVCAIRETTGPDPVKGPDGVTTIFVGGSGSDYNIVTDLEPGMDATEADEWKWGDGNPYMTGIDISIKLDDNESCERIRVTTLEGETMNCETCEYCGDNKFSADCTNFETGRRVECESAAPSDVFFPFTVGALPFDIDDFDLESFPNPTDPPLVETPSPTPKETVEVVDEDLSYATNSSQPSDDPFEQPSDDPFEGTNSTDNDNDSDDTESTLPLNTTDVSSNSTSSTGGSTDTDNTVTTDANSTNSVFPNATTVDESVESGVGNNRTDDTDSFGNSTDATNVANTTNVNTTLPEPSSLSGNSTDNSNTTVPTLNATLPANDGNSTLGNNTDPVLDTNSTGTNGTTAVPTASPTLLRTSSPTTASPTAAPTPAATAQKVPDNGALSDCNICGEGNTIQFGRGNVEFVYQGEKRKNNCNTWQNIVKNPNTIDPEFCKGEMLKYTAESCRCTDEFGNPVKYVPPGESDSSKTKDDTSSSSLLPAFSATSLVALMAMVLEL